MRRLDVSNCGLGPAALHMLCEEGVRSRASTLRRLNASLNPLTGGRVGMSKDLAICCSVGESEPALDAMRALGATLRSAALTEVCSATLAAPHRRACRPARRVTPKRLAGATAKRRDVPPSAIAQVRLSQCGIGPAHMQVSARFPGLPRASSEHFSRSAAR